MNPLNRSLPAKSHRWGVRVGYPTLFLSVCAGFILAGCQPKVNSGVGFQLPQGDPVLGKQAFLELKCNACHKVDGVELPAPTVPAESVVTLGGEMPQRRTYGRLMTAIVHPTQSVSIKSFRKPGQPPRTTPMPTLNETMTVKQLIDLITFLQPHYRDLQPLYEPVIF